MELIFDAERDFKNCLDTAYKEGYKEGLAAAKEEIKAANKAEGIVEIARNLKQIGLDVSKIAQVTGLSIEEIEQL
jgi:predicted transposase/invertase (TIGR01784 family)